MSGGYLAHTPHYKVFAIKSASDIVTSIIMNISDHYDLLAIILVSSIDLYNILLIKLILRVEVIVTTWIRNSETCLYIFSLGMWGGVGHEVAVGGGSRNSFGMAFKSAGSVSIFSISICTPVVCNRYNFCFQK